jgi:hypothetical protein
MGHYLGVAKKQKVSEKEMGTVLSIVMAVSGGRVRAQFREVRTQIKKKKIEKAQ